MVAEKVTDNQCEGQSQIVSFVFFALISTLDCYLKGTVRHFIISMMMFDHHY